MPIPHEIPAGARIVVRTYEGVDPADQRMKFRDFVGHVRSWDGRTLELMRDAAANGSRPAHRVSIRRRNRHDQTDSRTFHDPIAIVTFAVCTSSASLTQRNGFGRQPRDHP